MTFDDIVEQIRSLRESGNVKRVHTIPVVGDVTYTVGSHSWNAVSLLYQLHTGPSHNLVKALLWHDCAERWMGDIPWPAKHYNPYDRDWETTTPRSNCGCRQ